MVPIAAGDPSALGKLRGEIPDAVGKFLRRVRVAQVHRRQLKTATQEMHVSIVEAGQDELSFRVDHFGVSTSEFSDVLSRSDCDNAIAMNGDGFRGWLISIHRVNFGVHDDYVGDQRGFVGVCFEVHGHEQDQQRKQQQSKSYFHVGGQVFIHIGASARRLNSTFFYVTASKGSGANETVETVKYFAQGSWSPS